MIFLKCIFNLYLFKFYSINFQVIFTIVFPNWTFISSNSISSFKGVSSST